MRFYHSGPAGASPLMCCFASLDSALFGGLVPGRASLNNMVAAIVWYMQIDRFKTKCLLG